VLVVNIDFQPLKHIYTFRTPPLLENWSRYELDAGRQCAFYIAASKYRSLIDDYLVTRLLATGRRRRIWALWATPWGPPTSDRTDSGRGPLIWKNRVNFRIMAVVKR
jgi:hypothetical protein